MHRKRGLFVCFTGVDGSGKTTLAKTLVSIMKKESIGVKYVYNRYIPIVLRPVMLMGEFLFLRNKDFYRNYADYSNTKRRASKNHPLLAKFYQHLLLLDYFIQILFKIKLPLLFGKNIICDRYIYDTIVTDLSIDFNYSEGDVKNSLDKILSLFPTPDITFLVDLPEKIAYQRKNDIPSIGYLKERRKIYLYLGKEYDMRILDGSKKLAELQCEVEKEVFQ
ncbi:Thymidylate kinase [subsurface metagenome]